MKDTSTIILAITCILLGISSIIQNRKIDNLEADVFEYAQMQAEFDSIHLSKTHELARHVVEISKATVKLIEE